MRAPVTRPCRRTRHVQCSVAWRAALLLTCSTPVFGAAVREPGQRIIVPPPPPPAALLTVGSDPACDYQDLEFAILDSARFGSGQHLLRIAANYDDTVRAVVIDRSLAFEGGYETCSSNTRSAPTRLVGTGVAPLFEIRDTDGEADSIALDGLHLSNGWNDLQGGALLVSGSQLTVRVRNSSIVESAAWTLGGGLFVFEGHVVLENTTVALNRAASGGGIGCRRGRVTLLDSRVASNLASPFDSGFASRGGGLYLEDCELLVEAGGVSQGVDGNRANVGGGIYAVSSSIDLHGRQSDSLEVRFNTGGGLFAAGCGLQAEDVLFSGNDGSGVEVRLSTASIGRSSACARGDRCSRIDHNTGHALRSFDSDVTLSQTGIEHSGTAIRTDGTGVLRLSNDLLVVRSPNGETAIEASGEKVEILQSTVVGERRNVPLVAGTADLDIDESILWRLGAGASGATPVTTSGSLTVGCSIFDARVADLGSVFLVDPQFVDLLTGDFHLQPDSPAIDRCDPAGSGADIDGEGRPVDLAGVGEPALHGDVGADEHHPEVPREPIFTDGFESGDVSAWS